jgi:hypothetical protein
MGFHFRGWFGAWMAGEGGSAVSCGSPELLNGAAAVSAREEGRVGLL